MRKQRGITLIALVVTIIILIILSSIMIGNILGDHGIMNMATEAVIRTRIAEYKDNIDQIGVSITIEHINDKLTGREYLEEFKRKIEKSELFKDRKSAEIIGKAEGETEDKLRIVTKEGFIFDVTEKEINYVGSVGEEGFKPLPEIKKGSINIELDNNYWTHETPIYATITLKDLTEEELSGLIIQYTKDPNAKEGWTKYEPESKIDITTNGTIYARVKSNIGEVSKTLTATKKINNIDTIKPETPTEGKVTKITSNSITVTAKAKDAPATTEKPGEDSGVAKIIFELKGEIQGEQKTVSETKEVTAASTAEAQAEHTFTGLTQNKSYTITVKAIDKAENESAIATIETQPTKTVPGENVETGGSIKFIYNPSSDDKPWTNTKVDVTIESKVNDGEKYTIQYIQGKPTGNNDNWLTYENKAIEMTTNGTITARLKDNANQTGATATGTVSNIDRVLPKNPENVQATVVAGTDGKKNCIEVTATVEDQRLEDSTHHDELSGIKKVIFSANGHLLGEETVTTKDDESQIVTHRFEGQEDGTYEITVKAIDKAENSSSEVKATNNIIIDVTPPSAPTITMTDGEKPDQAEYTKNITVTITPGTDLDGVKETRYNITGAEQHSGTIVSGQKETITLTTNGTYEITATTEDNSGNVATTQKTVTKKQDTGYVGYYADIEGDGIVDGIIYADLAVGTTGAGKEYKDIGIDIQSKMVRASAYDIPVIESQKLGKYKITQHNYNGPYGIADVVAPVSDSLGQTDRFYVMDLSFQGNKMYYLYANILDESTDTFNVAEFCKDEFGNGRQATTKLFEAWNSELLRTKTD